jgi:hypothetical protein
MPLKSDVELDISALDPAAISPDTNALNESLKQLGSKAPKWWEVHILPEHLHPVHV